MFVSRCLSAVAKDLPQFNQDLEVLPKRIKCELLATVCRPSGNVLIQDATLLQHLLNSEVTSLDLTTSTNVTDALLEAIQQKCKKLRQLVLPSLNGTDCIKDTLYDLIPQLHTLQELRIRYSDIVDDYVIALLQKHCPRLRALDIEGCQNLSDDAMHHIVQMQLTTMNISRTHISDKGMKLMENSHLEDYLEDINVKNCRITCASLSVLRWDKIKYIGFEVSDMESKIQPESKKGTGKCWFRPEIILA